MTYEESYRQALTPEEILNKVKYDVAIATVTNTDIPIMKQVTIIKQVAEKVLKEKFSNFEGIIDD